MGRGCVGRLKCLKWPTSGCVKLTRSGWGLVCSPGEQVERQCPAKRFFVSRCKLLHTCTFLFDESGAECGAKGRRSAACMKDSGFVQRGQIRSFLAYPVYTHTH